MISGMCSLRTRLFALWLMLAVSGTVTAVLLVKLYQQSTGALVGVVRKMQLREVPGYW